MFFSSGAGGYREPANAVRGKSRGVGVVGSSDLSPRGQHYQAPCKAAGPRRPVAGDGGGTIRDVMAWCGAVVG